MTTLSNKTIAGDGLDLKTQHQLKNQAEMVNQDKIRFLSNLTHEIRTPLSAIIGFNQLLLKEGEALELPEAFQKKQQNIQLSSLNLLRMVNNFLDLSKIEAGMMMLSNEDFNLHAMIGSLFNNYLFLAQDKGLSLTCQIDENLPAIIHADWAKIDQIIANLVSNAILFTPAGKEVRLVVEREQDQIIIRVIDQGIGIADDRQQAIFSLFEQASATTVHTYGGTGLGLTMSKMLVDLLGGTISVVSQVEQGSTFTVSLPLKEALSESAVAIEASVERDEASDCYRNHSIVVIEDDLMIQRYIQLLLEDMGIELHFANNGLEGVELVMRLMAEERRPDLIFMDMQMPVMSGIEAILAIRHNPACQTIPIVMLTANAFIEDKKTSQEAGADDYLAKPIDLIGLTAILDKYLQ